MSALSACRMCLAVDARMYTIANTPLQDIYERITDIPLLNGDRRPERVCYLCHHLLRKHQAFMEKSVKADKILRLTLDRGIELTEASIRLMATSDVCSSFCVTHPECTDFVPQEQPTGDDTQEEVSTEIIVKVEPLDVKEEMEEVVEDSAFSQNEEEHMSFETETILQNVKDEDQTVHLSKAPMRDAGAKDLRTSVRVSEKRKLDQAIKLSENTRRQRRGMIEIVLTPEENHQQRKTPPKRCILTKATGVMGNVKVEGSGPDAESEQNDLNSQHDSNASKKVSFCELCGIHFKSFRLLNNHTQIDHSVVVICNYCCGVFNDKVSLVAHIKTHDANMHYQNASLISTTKKNQTSEKLYVCENCNEGFSYKSALTKHLRTHTGQKPHKCSYCCRAFSEKHDLKRHIFIHTGEKPYQCSHCSKAFTHKNNLREHALRHTGERPHRCGYCNKAFVTKNSLNQHIVRHNRKGIKPHQCTYCNKAFTQIRYMNAHILAHLGEKPHQCSYCNKAFTQKWHLNTHLLTHTMKNKQTKEKSHLCTYCNKAFTHKSVLHKHILTHTGEKPHQCSYCQKAFRHTFTLSKHILLHTGEKPHQCIHCSKAFTDKNSLKQHLLIHTGEKPHQCSYCGKAFSYKNVLKRHILIHTGEKQHRCSYCNRGFTQKATLKKHILTHKGKTSTVQLLQ